MVNKYVHKTSKPNYPRAMIFCAICHRYLEVLEDSYSSGECNVHISKHIKNRESGWGDFARLYVL